ncbi:MAG: metallophosphoesterase [Verrucomicrobia bacterium]|nr:metallophosphoesterase [Verrucomicrobiota bacterium]
MPTKVLRWSLSGLLVLLVLTGGAGCARPKNLQRSDGLVAPAVGATGNPWTSKVTNNDPTHFQFVVVTDRTGGVRPGVFEDAVKKINLLQPEFVMSVGDLITGHTEDRSQIDAEWREFMGFVEQLDMKFYYLPGNHDITNKIMEEEWIKRFGRLYYHFVYQNVLFLCLDSEDPPPTHISKAQQDYVAKALAENPNVHWTLVFLHKPLWDYEEDSGWAAVEAMIKKRPHTVIAGHRHTYTKFERNDTSYIVLATTGGGSKLRGRAFGEFDQVAWVTMTDKGPRIANLFLDGIWDENVLTEKMAKTMRTALEGKAVTSEMLIRGGKFRGDVTFPGAATKLKITNDTDMPMTFRARFNSTDQVHIKPAEAHLTLEPKSNETINVQFEVKSQLRVADLLPLTADWTITYEFPDVPPAEINGRQQW